MALTPKDLPQDEKGFIEAHPLIRVANEMDWPPFDFAENGIETGYSIDLIKLVAERTGLRLKFVKGYSWDALLKMGEQKQIDVFPAIWKTRDREQYFNFSEPYIDTPYILVINQGKKGIVDIDSLDGRTLTGIKGFASTEQVKKYYPGIHVLEVASAVDGLRQVSYGKADAYLGSMAETNFAIKSHLVPNLKIAGETTLGGKIKSSFLHIGVRKDRPVLLKIIQRGMNAISRDEKLRLQMKWLNFERKQQTMIFNDAEVKFLHSHPVLRVAVARDWPPVEYYSENGEMIGIAADFLNKIGKFLKVEIKPVTASTRLVMLNGIQNGSFDFVSAVSPTIRQNELLDFTDSYLKYPIVVVTREDVPYIGNLQFLKGESIAVVQGYVSQELMTSNYPGLNLIATQGVKEGLLLVANKEAFAFVGSLAAISHVIGREGLTGLKVSGETPYSVSIAMGARKGNTILIDLLQKALSSISMKERNMIYSKWSRVTFEYQADYSLLWKMGAAFLVIFTLILYWNRRLRVMANELKSARDSAESANKAKSVFLANMSHELRTPLNSILGFSQIMADDDILNHEQKDNLRMIKNSGEHLLGLLNDILDLSKIEAGRIILRESVFDLHNMIINVRDMLKPLANAGGLKLSVDIGFGTPRFVRADKARIRQVLVNLVFNAVKYTNKGSISVSVRGKPSDITTPETLLNFVVKDTGQGINPKFREKVFDPFVQVQSGKQIHEGTGLGLSICRTLVRTMGGDIKLESKVGKGSTFSFCIKVNTGKVPDDSGPASPGLPTSAATVIAPGQKDFRVLVVDDIEANRKLLLILLKKAGFLVRGADCAQDAFEIIKEWEPHMVWMDIHMPEIDGLEATRQIRKSGFDKLKIIGISASAFEDDRTACLEAGCDDFISKPVHRSEILEKMTHHLGVRYLYIDNEKDSGRAGPSAVELKQIAEALSSLPDNLSLSLKEAVFSFDYEMTMGIIDQIRKKNNSLADELSIIASGYQFGILQNLFKEIRKKQ